MQINDLFLHLITQKEYARYVPPLILGISGLVGAIALFFIEDKTAIMLSVDNQKRKPSQQTC